MKTIGLIGGMSWESTAEYYRILNQEVRRRLGGLHSAVLLLYSVDFDGHNRMQHAGRWAEMADALADIARRLEAAGAACLLLCTNTMHKVADAIQAAVAVPLLHIADATGEAVRRAGLSRVGLLGTAFTMEQEFYRGRLADRFGLEVLVPDEPDRRIVHGVIYDELCRGRIEPASRRQFVRIAGDLRRQGAEGVILGCTEIPLLLRPADVPLPLFDTTAIHARAAVDWALT